MIGYKIEQIMPADGWLSVWEDGSVIPLIGWALITETKSPTREVVGLTVTGDRRSICVAEKCRGFRGYHRDGDAALAGAPDGGGALDAASEALVHSYLAGPGFEP